MTRIPVAGPWISDREIDYVAEAARSAWYGDAQKYHRRFELAFGKYVGVRHAIALPSCTSAIHLSLLALGIGPGDEVVVPDITWIATAAPISYVGATPVFVDIDPLDWCLDPGAFAAAITPRTRAVIAVDLYGNMPAFDELSKVAERHNIAVIEDAAEAIGSEYHGRRSGACGSIGVFSFHGSKTLTTGEGGMLVTDSDDVAARVQVLRDHGRLPGDREFRNVEVAFKYKMSSFQAAFGLAQLERVHDLVAKKRAIFGWYRNELAGLRGVTLNHERDGTTSSYWMVTLMLEPHLNVDKQALAAALGSRGIDTRPFFHPLSSLPAYAGTVAAEGARQRNRVSYALTPYGINLPSALSLTPEDVKVVCRAVRDTIQI